MSTLSMRIRARVEPVLALKSGVILMPVEDGSARLLDLGGRFYAVSAVAAELIRETLNVGPTAAAATVAARYGVAEERVRADLTSLLGDLKRQGLLGRPGAGGWRARLASALLAPVLVTLHCPLLPMSVRAWALLGLAKLTCRLFGWSRTVEAWQKHHRTPQAREAADLIATVDRAVRKAASGHLLTVECKERALSSWTLLRVAGLPAELVVGINLFPLEGHCWCESGPSVLSDYPDRCATFTPVIRYS